MQTTLNSEIFNENQQEIKALMNLQKFYSAFIALLIGYSFSIMSVIYEKFYWRYKIESNPFYNKYVKKIIMPNNKTKTSIN